MQDSEQVLAEVPLRCSCMGATCTLTLACHTISKALLVACASCVSHYCVCCGLQGYRPGVCPAVWPAQPANPLGGLLQPQHSCADVSGMQLSARDA
jgi:hypothetical protein